MQLAVISTVINLLLLACVPGHIPVPRYGKEMKRKQRTPSPRQEMVWEGSRGGEERSACRRTVVICNFASGNLQQYTLETPSLAFGFIT